MSVEVVDEILDNPEKSVSEILNEGERFEQQQEEFDDTATAEAIVDLIENDFTSNEDQGAFAELVQGMAFSDNSLATAFIAQMQDGEDLKGKALQATSEAEVSDEIEEMIEAAEPSEV